MWDWYNRPGGRATLPTRAVIIALVLAGLLLGAATMLLYILLAPLLFSRVPR